MEHFMSSKYPTIGNAANPMDSYIKGELFSLANAECFVQESMEDDLHEM